MQKVILFIIPLFIFTSCVIQFVNGNEYETLTESEKLKVHRLESFNDLKPKHIYEITGIQLLNELKTKDKSLVYIFANNCNSESCIPINIIENHANENDLSFYPIMISYYKVDITLSQPINTPLFSINNNYYNEDKERKYVDKFKKDIGYNYFSNNKYLGGYIYFQRDNIIAIKNKLSN